MLNAESCSGSDISDWLCPDLSQYWRLGRLKQSNKLVLFATDNTHRFHFSEFEGFALAHFTGQFTAGQVQELCYRQFGDAVSSVFIQQLIEKLIQLNVLADNDDETVKTASSSSPRSLQLRAELEWIAHPDGYWILHNPVDMKFLQLEPRAKEAIEHLGQVSTVEIPAYCDVTIDEVRLLLKQLALTGMLEGVAIPTPPKRKFTPFQLLYFRKSLFNPDTWLTRHIDKLRWIWTQAFWFFLCAALSLSTLLALHHAPRIWHFGQQLVEQQGASLFFPFAMLSMAVVSLHELGHAFTLKHYGGRVPDVGLLFMFLIPAAYTNTTDSYRLVKRRQRLFVVGAGVICQLIIWAIAFWIYLFSATDSQLHSLSFLVMAAALFTVALNLNPLAKFDGYYLAVALTGINNLRERSFRLYQYLLRGWPIPEQGRDAWVLAAYAPFSLIYILLVFGRLFLWLGTIALTHAPYWSLTLLVLWLIYYFYPRD